MEWFLQCPHNPGIDTKPVIFDTTLRDGEQTPGVSFSPEMKLKIAGELSALGIKEIEAGFPVVSQGEFKAVRMISKEGLPARIFALSRAIVSDVELAVDAGVDGISLFTSISPVHLKYKMRYTKEEVVKNALEALEFAKDHNLFVSFSSEDATRTPLGELFTLYKMAEERGADRVHISDTVGVATPQAYQHMVEFFRRVMKKDTQIGVHTHNDFGLATANALAGVAAGADMVSVTVNGIGERSGNASLQEVALALEVLYGTESIVDKSRILLLSRLVEEYSGIRIPENKPIIGKNAFRHESGVHVDAVLKNPLTYEPFLPEVIGQKREIVIGKHSGKHAVKNKLSELGLHSTEYSELLGEIKRIVDKGYGISEDDIEALIKG
ncbi:MAG TPA: homoaconitate hydratase [Euryarchaeota archaeon]|nr:homoaconitate hydratase [Euryarchaeota archaeon]